MSLTVNTNPQAITWGTLLNDINKANGADATQQVSDTNRAVTFATEVNGAMTTVTVNIPDDLDLPSAVTPEAIDSLIEKLAASVPSLDQSQLAAIKDEITKVYNNAAKALSSVQSASVGAVLFDLYQLMALLVEVAQSQRNAARDLRNSENMQIQSSIQAQADAQRNAAIVGLAVGVTCGVVSALVSAGMLVGQGAAYSKQVNTARASGMEAAQNKVTMLQNADTAVHAQAQLAKVERGIDAGVATEIKNTINQNTAAAKAKFESAKQDVTTKQTALDAAQAELTQARTNQATKQTAVDEAQAALDAAKTEAQIPAGKTAAMAKQEYMRQCIQDKTQPEEQRVAKIDAAVQAESRLNAAKSELQSATSVTTQKELAVNGARDALAAAKTELKTAGSDYRAALELEADHYATEYENAVAQDAPKSEVNAARDKMLMARAYANNEMMKPDLQPTPTEYKEILGHAKNGADMAAQRLNNNMDYRDALRRIELFAGINAINTAIGNVLQSMTQSISGSINSDATRMGAEQKKQEEQLDQMRDLFSQAQNVVNAAVQLMQAVRQAETQSMRDAIQA